MRRRVAFLACAGILASFAYASNRRAVREPFSGLALRPPPDALSAFGPITGGCEWKLISARSAEERVVATLPESCDGVRVAWSPDGTRALVSVPDRTWQGHASTTSTVADSWITDAPVARIYEIDLGGRRVHARPVPAGIVRELAFGWDGTALAYAQEAEEEAILSDFLRGWLGFETQASNPFGMKVIEFALRETAWKTEKRYDGPPLGLPAKTRPLWYRSSEMVRASPPLSSIELRGVTALHVDLAPGTILDGGPIGYHGDFVKGRVTFLGPGDELVRTEGGFDEQAAIAVTADGLLLVTRIYSGESPRVYEHGVAAPIWMSDSLVGVTVWPPPLD